MIFIAASVVLTSCVAGGNDSSQNVSSSQNNSVNGANPGFSTIDARGLQSEIESGQKLVIVDLREPELFRVGHIPGARNIVFEQFRERMNELSPEDNIVLVCHNGPMGNISATLLVEKGYAKVRNLGGGMAAWNGELAR